MLRSFFKICSLVLFFPILGFASINPVMPQSITIATDSEEDIVENNTPVTWNSGSMRANYIASNQTQKKFNNISLIPGIYKWEIQTQARNGGTGGVSFKVEADYFMGSNEKMLSEKLNSAELLKGKFALHDNFSKYSPDRIGGSGKLIIDVKSSSTNTNLNYTIKFTRIKDLPCRPGTIGFGIRSALSSHPKSVKSMQAACKNKVEVKIEKTGGNGKVAVKVYAASTLNGSGKLVKTFDFPDINTDTIKKFTVSGINGKYIRVELKYLTRGSRFQSDVTISQ